MADSPEEEILFPYRQAQSEERHARPRSRRTPCQLPSSALRTPRHASVAISVCGNACTRVRERQGRYVNVCMYVLMYVYIHIYRERGMERARVPMVLSVGACPRLRYTQLEKDPGVRTEREGKKKVQLREKKERLLLRDL